MDRLRQFYKTALQYVFGAVAFIGLFIGFYYAFPPEWLRYVITVAGLMFLAIEWLVRTHAWKALHNDLNIVGKWEAETTYDAAEIPPKITSAPALCLSSPTKKHTATFHQDCLTLAIKLDGAAGAAFPIFYSLAINLEPHDVGGTDLNYAYYVKYTKESASGCHNDEATGYESMKIIKYEDLSGMRAQVAKFGLYKARPIKMQGEFWHCAKGDGIAYRGRALFWRSL